jgi:arylsulfatase A-like enzyme
MSERARPRAGGLGLLALCLCAACGGEPQRRSVLVVTVDTLRRDHAGFLGRSPSPTPALDALAQEAVVFEDAYTVAPVTLPAHTSLMTGLYPAAHGVRDNGATRVPEEAETLAEILGRSGYQTRAVVAAFVLNECFGLAQGFDAYDAPTRGMQSVDVHVREVRGDELVDRGLRAARELAAGEEPFLLFLHLYDPHFPYEAPGSDPTRPTPELYADEVRFADAQLGRLFAGLRELGVWDDLVVVVASDHGEGLEDGKEATHGYFLYDETMRVPVLLKHPDLAPRRVAGPVSLVDVAPTLLELLDLPAPMAGFDGTSLVAAARSGQAPGGRTLALETYLPFISHGWAPSQGGVDSELKLIRSRASELYDRRADPAEDRDLHGQDAREPALAAKVERLFASAERRLARTRVELDANDRALLASLGYASAAGPVDDLAVDFATLPDARQRYPLMKRLWAVLALVEEGRSAEGLDLVRALAREDPSNPEVLVSLAKLAVESPLAPLTQVDEAERALARARVARPLDAEVPWLLARCAKRRADDAKARLDAAAASGDETAGQQASSEWRAQVSRFHAELRRVLELEPGHVKALAVLAAALYEEASVALSVNRPDLAQQELAEVVSRCDDLLKRLTPEEASDTARFSELRNRAAGMIERIRAGGR